MTRKPWSSLAWRLLVPAIAVIACRGDAPSATQISAGTRPATVAAATPSPAATETRVPPTWIRDVKTITNPTTEDGTAWHLAAGEDDGERLILRRNEGGGDCHDPVRTMIAWYEFGGDPPTAFYATEYHMQVSQIAANGDYVAWTTRHCSTSRRFGARS